MISFTPEEKVGFCVRGVVVAMQSVNTGIMLAFSLG